MFEFQPNIVERYLSVKSPDHLFFVFNAMQCHVGVVHCTVKFNAPSPFLATYLRMVNVNPRLISSIASHNSHVFLQDERRIRERITSIMSLWNANQVQAVLDIFADDVIYMPPGGPEIIGRDGM